MTILKNNYTQRLLDEWIQHGNIIIGLDFDDTIWAYRENFTDTEKVISLVKECTLSGAKVIIYTGSVKERHSDIEEHCKNVGIQINTINQNLITPFGDNRKIYANIYLDDRAGLTEAMEILSSALYQYRAYLRSQDNLADVA